MNYLSYESSNMLSPLYSKFSLTQSVRQTIQNKYEDQFYFFSAKGINHIIDNRKLADSNLSFKDMLIHIDETQFLKKYYKVVNSQGKAEAKDRMSLLLKYYSKAQLLQYEYPMMVINQKKQLFLRRKKEMEQLSNPDSEEQASEQTKNNNSQIVFKQKFNQEEEYLLELNWSKILQGRFQEQHPHVTPRSPLQDLSFEEEPLSIFDQPNEVKRHDFLAQLEDKEKPFAFNDEEQENNHLIIDFDHLDGSRIVAEYTKLMNKQNICHSIIVGKPKKATTPIVRLFQGKQLTSSIILTGHQQTPNGTQKDKGDQKNMSFHNSMMIGSRQERFHQSQIMNKSLLMSSVRSKTNSQECSDQVIEDKQSEKILPSFSFSSPQFYSLDLPKRDKLVTTSQFLTPAFGKKQKFVFRKNSQMKKSKLEEQGDTLISGHLDLVNFKETPLELTRAQEKGTSAMTQTLPPRTLSRMKSLQHLQRQIN